MAGKYGGMLSSPMFKHKDTYFLYGYTTPEIIDSLEHMEIRDSDVFLVTYPKSGTVWTQQILCLIYNENERNCTGNLDAMARAPSIEYNLDDIDFESLPSPRLFISHLRNQRGKVLYVYRNPKDNMVSRFHFVKKKHLISTWEPFFDYFMAVVGGLWFDHTRNWYTHKEEFNCLFLSYEEMVKDLRTSILQVCEFLGINLDDEAINRVMEKSAFENMKQAPVANFRLFSKTF